MRQECGLSPQVNTNMSRRYSSLSPDVLEMRLPQNSLSGGASTPSLAPRFPPNTPASRIATPLLTRCLRSGPGISPPGTVAALPSFTLVSSTLPRKYHGDSPGSKTHISSGWNGSPQKPWEALAISRPATELLAQSE